MLCVKCRADVEWLPCESLDGQDICVACGKDEIRYARAQILDWRQKEHQLIKSADMLEVQLATSLASQKDLRARLALAEEKASAFDEFRERASEVCEEIEYPDCVTVDLASWQPKGGSDDKAD